MAGDLPNRDITAGAPDAIVDMKYGNSYTPTIMKAYKGSTLIYERDMDWLYEINDVDCNKAHTLSNYLEYQPESMYSIQESIRPFGYDNFDRDWEFLINVNSNSLTSDTLTIPLFTTNNFSGYDGFIDNTGGPNIELYLWIVPSSSGDDRIRVRGSDSIFSDYSGGTPGGGDIANAYYSKSLYGSILGKDIRLVKTSVYEDDERINKIEIYIGGLLVITLKVADVYSYSCRLGSIMRDSSGNRLYFLDGYVKYFKFRFNSDPGGQDYSTTTILRARSPLGRQGRDQTVYEDDFKKVTTTVSEISHGTTYCVETVEVTHYKDASKEDEEHVSVTNNRIGWSGNYSYGPWTSYYNSLVSENVDGFGIDINIENDSGLYYYYNSDTESITRSYDHTTGGGGQSPFIFNGGGDYQSGNGYIQVGYDKTKTSVNDNFIRFMGYVFLIPTQYTSKRVVHIKAIYFNKTRQAILYDGDYGKVLKISDIYTPTTLSSSNDKGTLSCGCIVNNEPVCSTHITDLECALFTIKYTTQNEEED